jgi:hypothetical protein
VFEYTYDLASGKRNEYARVLSAAAHAVAANTAKSAGAGSPPERSDPRPTGPRTARSTPRRGLTPAHRCCPIAYIETPMEIPEDEAAEQNWNQDLAVPEGLVLGMPDLYRLQARVGSDRCWGVAVIDGRGFGLTSDGGVACEAIVVDMSGAASWPDTFRTGNFGDAITWVADRLDSLHGTKRPDRGTVCVALVNSASLEAVVVETTDYVLQREEFSDPTVVVELGRFDSVRSAIDDQIWACFA